MVVLSLSGSRMDETFSEIEDTKDASRYYEGRNRVIEDRAALIKWAGQESYDPFIQPYGEAHNVLVAWRGFIRNNYSFAQALQMIEQAVVHRLHNAGQGGRTDVVPTATGRRSEFFQV